MERHVKFCVALSLVFVLFSGSIGEAAAVNNSVTEAVAFKILEDNFAGSGEVSFDREFNLFMITPTDPSVAVELMLASEGNAAALNDWVFLKDSFVTLSSVMSKSLPGYSVALANPMNTDNVLLLVTDGVVVYDAFE